MMEEARVERARKVKHQQLLDRTREVKHQFDERVKVSCVQGANYDYHFMLHHM